MLWFKRKKEEKRLDDVDLKRLAIRVTKLEAEMLDLAVSQDTIRNKVLRKIQSKRPKEEESSEVDEEGFLKTI